MAYRMVSPTRLGILKISQEVMGGDIQPENLGH